ncbi:hypothetical protein [Halomontanus rarus]|uniref:hypothetical protein n=1 Tax=Halomontanus rarus TaxID=3034020 RepID=UPI001A996888|nr:hypothetical protein [Halovivax sp. TS33]
MKATSTPGESRDPHIEIANWLFVRLALVLACTLLVTRIVVAGAGAAGLVLALGLFLTALWVTVHLVFSALNDLLEAKLDAVS